jgi:hypothetical protein
MSDDVITRILAIVEKLERGQDQFRADLTSRVDRLQDKPAAQREGDGVGSAERAERIAKAAQDEVRLLAEQMNLVFRHIRHLQTELRELRSEDES